MISKKWTTGFVLMGTLLLVPAEAAALRARVSIGFGHRPLYSPVRCSSMSSHRHFAPRVVTVEKVRYGSIDFNIRPQKSRVYINGRLLGLADDFNGYPQTARLPAGTYTVRVVSPEGRVEERRIYVGAGRELNFNLRF